MAAASSEESPPFFAGFSHAMAAVSSRAFSNTTGVTDNSSSMMVPLLDLCNHRRGCNIETKNLSYSFQKDGTVAVKAATTIQAGDTLRITSCTVQSRMLSCSSTTRGVCIPDNLEPDGSSNDILEFTTVATETAAIPLRTGPKFVHHVWKFCSCCY